MGIQMKQHLSFFVNLCFLATIITGCASVKTAKVKFITPGNDGVALASGSKIKIVSNRNDEVCNSIKNILMHEFQEIANKNVKNAVKVAQEKGEDPQKAQAKAESEQILISDANPDYWLFLSFNSEYRKDGAEVTDYNRIAMRVKEENQAGGREVIKLSQPYQTGSAAAVVNMVLYSVHGLVPVHSFGITIYDSEFAKDALKNEGQYLKLFAIETVKRIEDGFLTMEREMTVLIPPSANGKLESALKSKDSNKMKEVAMNLKLSPLDKFLEEINALEAKHKPELFNDSKMLEKMANHYVYAIDFESRNLDTRSLRLAQRCYLAMLKNTNDDLLAEACANSLARVERKLELLESVKQ